MRLRLDERLLCRVRGRGFLEHLVRNLDDIDSLPLKSGPTAPAQGLFLVSVEY